MTKLICISLTLITAVSAAAAQTRQISPEEWGSAIRGENATPGRPTAGPSRIIYWWNSFDQGDPRNNSSRRTVTENFNSREGHELSESRIGTGPPDRSERVWKDGVEHVRSGDGKWARKQNKPDQGEPQSARAKSIDSTKPGPNGEPPTFTRKSGAEEISYFALGKRLYKREVVTVYEEVTRHVLIRLSDKSEIHYENRTRYWLDRNRKTIRVDRNYVIYSDGETTRILSGYEWENDPAIKPVVLPVD